MKRGKRLLSWALIISSYDTWCEKKINFFKFNRAKYINHYKLKEETQKILVLMLSHHSPKQPWNWTISWCLNGKHVIIFLLLLHYLLLNISTTSWGGAYITCSWGKQGYTLVKLKDDQNKMSSQGPMWNFGFSRDSWWVLGFLCEKQDMSSPWTGHHSFTLQAKGNLGSPCFLTANILLFLLSTNIQIHMLPHF